LHLRFLSLFIFIGFNALPLLLLLLLLLCVILWRDSCMLLFDHFKWSYIFFRIFV
jgi:hypothetical protein